MMDSVLVTNEVRRKRKGCAFINVDFEKACD